MEMLLRRSWSTLSVWVLAIIKNVSGAIMQSLIKGSKAPPSFCLTGPPGSL